MTQQQYGLILRSYAKSKDEAPKVVDRAIKSINHAKWVYLKKGIAAFGRIVVVTPKDYDCGATAVLLREKLFLEKIDDRVLVIEPEGHHSREALNAAVELLADEGYTKTVIISNKAIANLKGATMQAVEVAFEQGAKVVGVAIDEMRDVVREGRIQNTFAAWDIPAILNVGVFDAADGVEEVAPSVRILQKHGPCIAVLVPEDVPPLDIRESADGVARHKEVMDTKHDNQMSECERLGVDFSFIKSGVMPGYPAIV